ncbi:6-phospho-beta-glucosidase [Rathayibacter soli]|uniref:6-phospho-beta-glucosidase n=1 Tax=Rathayibacter soli TaxID=3144168 RepID=UPI0027E4096A|nr:6-phospho-beta-glucosidase [Glaciibacter superstes]
MKLTILGGGGFRTPIVYHALLRDTGAPRITEVALLDVDAARLESISRVLREQARGFPDAPTLTTTTDARTAIAGADFVFAAIRVGGLAGRRADEHVALSLGVLGQETTGPGGIAYALRTVPVMLDYARLIAELAPDAYLLNFTNPAGIITEALQAVLGDRVLGICDTPSGLGRRLAALLGPRFGDDIDPGHLQFDYIGLNHLGWMRRVLYDGRDLLPNLLADDNLLGTLEESQVFGRDWIRALGAIPNEYLYYYYFNREAVANVLASPLTRGDFLEQTQGAFFRELSAAPLLGTPLSGTQNDPVALWRAAVRERDASYMAEAKGGVQGHPKAERELELDPAQQGYAGVALAVMRAISRNEPTTMILNVRNAGTIAGLPDDAVVEVPTLVDADGVHPLNTPAPDLGQLGLMQRVKAVERHAIAAATTGNASEALKAFSLHPLVDSVTVGKQLLAGYREAIPAIDGLFKRP